MQRLPHKEAALRRELLFSELFVPSLMAMERRGGFDREALLIMQDSQALRVIALCPPEESDLAVFTEMLKGKMIELDESEESSSSDLLSYQETAESVLAVDARRHGVNLKDIADHIKEAAACGAKVDIGSVARHAYMSMAKLGALVERGSAVGGTALARSITSYLESGIVGLAFDGPNGHSGRQLLLAVDQIGADPEAYIEFSDSASTILPGSDPWDFEPAELQGYEF